MSRKRALSPLDFLRMLLVEFPLAILIGCVAVSWGINHFYHDYYEIYMQSLLWTDEKQDTESTYYRRVCTEEDFSTDNLHDMLVAPNETAEEAVDKLLYHGSVIFPKLVSDESAQELRQHILERNHVLTKEDVEFIWLISQTNRWSYKVDVDDHPSVEKVMHEVATNAQFSETLEALFGSHPALVELTAITSAYGAGDQHFHKDNTADQTTQFYARSFADMYSVFIPLQDVTAEMGATDACPGLHICHNENDLCDDETALRLSSDERLWQSGDAWIFQMSVDHRGPAHTAEGEPHRVILVLTFTARPNVLEHDLRIPSLETSYSLKMEMSGLTLTDFQRKPKSWFWKTLTYLGIYDTLGWNYVHFSAQRIINEQFGFRGDDLQMHLKRMNQKSSTSWLGKIREQVRQDLFGGQMPRKQSFRKNDDLQWKVYLETCIERMNRKSFQAFVLALKVYVGALLITLIVPVPGRSRFNRMMRSILSVFMLGAPLVIMVFVAHHSLKTSQWGRDVRGERIFERPFLDPDIPSAWRIPSRMGPTIFPWKQDVLIPTRLDAPGLAAKNRFLEISHPGNRNWKQLVDQYATAFLTTISVVQDVIVTLIQNEIGQSSEFMLQNHEGNWVLLNDLEARKYTRRKLLEHDPLLGVLGRTIRELGSQLRHGRDRHTAMSRLHLPAVLYKMENIIYKETSEVPKMKRAVKVVEKAIRMWKAQELPKNPATRKTKRSFGIIKLEGVNRYEWSIGDTVIAFDGNDWLKGTIEKTFTESRLLFFDVELANGELLRGVSEELIRFYYDGMTVEGDVEEKDDQRLSRIVRVTSHGEHYTEAM